MKGGHSVCGSCGGPGGFKVVKNMWYDSGWVDCPVCSGYGFVKSEDKKAKEVEVAKELDFDYFRKKIIDSFNYVAEVNVITYDEFGKDLTIHLAPTASQRLEQLLRHLVRIESNNENIRCTAKRAFLYDKEQNSCFEYWELVFSFKTIDDLETLLEITEEYTNKNGGGLGIGYGTKPYRGLSEQR